MDVSALRYIGWDILQDLGPQTAQNCLFGSGCSHKWDRNKKMHVKYIKLLHLNHTHTRTVAANMESAVILSQSQYCHMAMLSQVQIASSSQTVGVFALAKPRVQILLWIRF